MTNIIVVGGGPAGVTAALRARELGANVTLVERGRLGGVCTNDGCAPTRVLAKAARLVREAEQFGDYGLIGQPPTVDLAELLARVQQTIYRLQEKKQLLSHLEEAGVKVLAEVGEARFVDAHTLVLAGSNDFSRSPATEVATTILKADKFILCVGGHARRLNFPGSEYALTHSDVWTMRSLPRSVAVVGAAATGCQLASILAAFGAQTHLLDLAPRILPAEDENVSAEIANGFRKHGIKIITGIGGVHQIDKIGSGLCLHYKSGADVLSLEVEAVIMATGWAGNVERLNAEAAGIKTEHGYVVVDDFLRSTAPHIFAAGDITGRMMLVQSAGYEARVAAENAVLGLARKYEHRIVPHGGFTDPEYGSVGFTEAQARAAEPDCVVARVSYAELDRPVIDGRPDGFCKLIVSRATRQLLGAHVVGEQAVEVVQLIATGMAAGLQIEQLAELELAYPTFTEIVGLAARQSAHELAVTPLAPHWRALGQRSALTQGR
ncbi:MAG: NAD(P)/FAD-dependent oxidoreductase [Chloroflexi bacterium]|nr:NAD(P)/FAD-dependent oxidoreductase [Chloroflexota bacterium]